MKLNLSMTKTQKLIYYSLIFSGILVSPLVLILTDEYYRFPFWISLLLVTVGNIYAALVLWKARRFDKFKKAGLSFGVMAITLLLLYLIWG